MDLLNRILCLFLLSFLVIEIFPQEQSYFPIDGNSNNLFTRRSIFNLTTITPVRDNNNSAEILDSLICVSLDGYRIRVAYNYNNDLSLNYFIFAHWLNGEWVNVDKRTNTYNSDKKLESVLSELFNTSLQEWLKVAKDVYNYDSLGNQISHLHQVYDGQEFIDDFRYENFYNTTNNVILSLGESWINGKWENSSKSIYTYNNTNLNDTSLSQLWKNDQWVNHQLNIYEYDEKLNVISNLAKRWQENNWLNFGMGSFEYDINNNCVLEIWKIANSNNWENWFRILRDYDDNNNLIHLFGEEWINGQWVPENEPLRITNPDGISFGFIAKEIFLYYSPPTSVGSEKNIANEFNLLQNYPNPFNPSTTIRYSIPGGTTAKITLSIYDILGNEVVVLVNEEKPAGEYQVEWDASVYSTGIYFYKLTAGEFTATKKLLLMK